MINYKGTPLLGEDSNPQHTSEFFAIAGTVLFWLIFTIFSFAIKPQPKKPEYKEVQIVLSSTPVVQKTEEAPAPAEAAAASAASSESVVEQVVETPVVETPAPKVEPAPVKETPPAPKPKVETPKQKTQSTPKQPVQRDTDKSANKTNVTSSANSSNSVESTNYAFDMSAGVNFNNIKKTKNVNEQDFDAKFRDDEPENVNDKSNQIQVLNDSPAIAGIAGTVNPDANTKLESESFSGKKGSQDASASTINALQNIQNSVFKGNAANGIQSETSVKTKQSGSGRVEMEMDNGRTRALIDPEKPIINIPPELYHLIDSTRTVKITFTVVPSGNVKDVRISPESSLHSSIRQEIIGQLMFWRFEPADYTATAKFDYTIIKR